MRWSELLPGDLLVYTSYTGRTSSAVIVAIDPPSILSFLIDPYGTKIVTWGTGLGSTLEEAGWIVYRDAQRIA